MSDNKQVSSLDEAAELLPCPFCGNDNIKIGQFARNGIFIKCPSCVIQYKQKTIRHSLDWLKEEMIKTWNTRQSQQKETKVRARQLTSSKGIDFLDSPIKETKPVEDKPEYFSQEIPEDILRKNLFNVQVNSLISNKVYPQIIRSMEQYASQGNSVKIYIDEFNPIFKQIKNNEISVGRACELINDILTSQILGETPKPVSEEGEGKMSKQEANDIINSEFYKANK